MTPMWKVFGYNSVGGRIDKTAFRESVTDLPYSERSRLDHPLWHKKLLLFGDSCTYPHN